MPRGRPCKTNTQADDIALHWAITWPDDRLRSQLERWAATSRLVENAEVRSVTDVLVLFVRFKTKRSYLNVQDLVRKLPNTGGARAIRIQSLTTEEYDMNLQRDAASAETALGKIAGRLTPAVRAALRDGSRIDLAEIFAYPASEWPEDLVAEYLRCSNRNVDSEPTLERITHLRRFGKKACYEFKCMLRAQKGPAAPFWIQYTDLIRNKEWGKTLDNHWHMYEHVDEYTSGESAYADSLSSQEDGTFRRRAVRTIRKLDGGRGKTHGEEILVCRNERARSRTQRRPG